MRMDLRVAGAHIVKKNGIMMVDFAIQAEREQNLSPHDAIRQACLRRFRPIMMTTMAALLGALPLALGRGTGSELRQPLGYTMVGGLIVSQALTLFTTPVIYLYLDQFSLWLKRHRKSQPIESRRSQTSVADPPERRMPSPTTCAHRSRSCDLGSRDSPSFGLQVKKLSRKLTAPSRTWTE